MVNLLRRHQQILMLVITMLVIVAFVWLYNNTQLDKLGSNRIATIYGRSVTQPEIDRIARKAQLSMTLGLFDILRTLGGGNSETQMMENFIWNSMVLDHEANVLRIAPTEEQLIEALKQVRAFQTNGAFDPAKYALFIQQQLPPMGMSKNQLEDLIRDSLRLKQLRTLIDSTVEPSEGDFRAAYEQAYAKLEASMINFNLKDLIAGINISEDDTKKAFEQRQASFNTEEKRKLSYLKLQLLEADAKLTGKERTEKLQLLADRAQEIAQAMLVPGANFEAIAGKFSLKPSQTVEFTRTNPDPVFANKDQIVAAAFNLSAEDPNSDVLQDVDGFFILHLIGLTPSRPLTYEEAKPQLIELLKKERAQEALTLKAGETRTKILAELKAGKSFAEAAKTAGQKIEVLAPFSMAAPPTDASAQSTQAMAVAYELKNGQLSEFTPTSEGGFLVFVAKRLPIDEQQFATDKLTMLPRFAESRRQMAFVEWLRLRRNEARIQVAGRR